ncbi:MAG: MobA/MobL family protein, partial [Steroidobacteraceae bacterium]
LMTTRAVTPHGLGERIAIELGGRERHLRGLGSSRDEYLGLRARWADLTNEALREAGLAQRVDHRSYAAQGLDRDPTTTIPEKVFYAERRAGPSVAGQGIRARALERAEARRRGPEELSRVLARQEAARKDQARQAFAARAATPRPRSGSQLTRAQRNALRRAQYQARRVVEKQDPALEERRREARRREYLAFRQKHPEYARAATRRYRAAHRDVVNQNQRDYRRARREQQQVRSVSPEQSLANWKAYRRQHGTGPTPEESLRRWRELRARAHEPGATPAVAQPDRDRDRDRDREPDLDLGL